MTLQNNHPDFLNGVTTVVLAGGQGTRLFPLTQSRCKPAVAFGGGYRLIDVPISNSLNSRIRRIAVISQYFAAELHQHIFSTYRLDKFQAGQFDLLCPEETPKRKAWFQGTADAVRQNLDRLLSTPAEYFLILSGDQLYNMDFKPMLEFAMEKEADLVIASLPVKEAEARRMGLLLLNESSRVVDFHEKPSDPTILARYSLPKKELDAPRYLGSMGIYIFKRSALISILQEEGEDFGRHIIPLEVKRGRTFGFVFDGYWEDIGTIASYYQANLALTRRRDCLNVYSETSPIYTQAHHLPSTLIQGTHLNQSIVSPGGIIEAEEITNSVIGIRAQIKHGTIIRDSIVLGHQPQNHLQQKNQDFYIGENCIIEKAIIDEHTQIGKNVRLINQQQLQHYDGNGIFIRDGIMIVTSGTNIPDGFTF